jgi:hypothetical protein
MLDALRLLARLAAVSAVACAGPQIGRPFPIDPVRELKLGYDEKADVLREMGQPYRSFVDSQGHEVFVYVWADGRGGGQKCLIAFNENDVVYLVELAR